MTGIRCRCACLAATILLSVGCSQNPAARRRNYFNSGMRYFQKADYRAAAIEFRNALEADGKYADAHYGLAQSYLKLGFWTEAYKELLTTINLDPGNEKAHADLSRLLLDTGKFEDARNRATAALSIDPHDFNAQLVLANAETALGDIRQGLSDAQKAVDIAPDKPEPYINLALLQTKSNQRPEDAEANLLKAVSVAPDFLLGRLALGEFYQSLHRWTDAEAQFRAAMAHHRESPRPRAALAALYLVEGKKAEAEQHLIDSKPAMVRTPEGYRMLGDFYIRTGDTQKALNEFSNLYKEHPDDLAVARTYIELLVFANQLVEAKQLNAKLLQRNARDAEALLLQGEILAREDHPAEAIPEFQAALEGLPNSPIGHFELGKAYLRTGAKQEAENEFLAAVRISPLYVEAHRALAELAIAQQDWQTASESGDKLIQAEPFAGEGYFYRASVRLGRKDLPGAEADLNKAIELSPGDARIYTAYGVLRIYQNMPDEAQRLFQQALDHDNNALQPLRSIVLLELRRNRPASALEAVQRAIAKSPRNSDFQLLLSRVYAQNKDQQKAMTAASQALELNKNNVDARLFLSLLQAGSGLVDQALAGEQQAIQANPMDPRLYFDSGRLEESRGNWQAAEQLYRKALQVEPDYALAANNLAYLLLEHGKDNNAALTLAQTARRGLPDLPNTADTLAWAYYQIGAYSSAIDLLQEAIKKSPSNPTYRYHLGLAYAKSNELQLARKEFQQALKLKPTESQTGDIQRALAQSRIEKSSP